MSLQRMWRVSFVLYLVLLSWQLLTPTTLVSAGSWDKLIHFTGFYVLASLALQAEWHSSTYKFLLVLIVYAALTEVLQHLIPGRSFSVLDWIADSAGILVALKLNTYFPKRLWILSRNCN